MWQWSFRLHAVKPHSGMHSVPQIALHITLTAHRSHPATLAHHAAKHSGRQCVLVACTFAHAILKLLWRVHSCGLCSYGLCSYGLHKQGLHSYVLNGYGLYGYRLYSYGLHSRSNYTRAIVAGIYHRLWAVPSLELFLGHCGRSVSYHTRL